MVTRKPLSLEQNNLVTLALQQRRRAGTGRPTTHNHHVTLDRFHLFLLASDFGIASAANAQLKQKTSGHSLTIAESGRNRQETKSVYQNDS
jgi:hypothetical protein